MAYEYKEYPKTLYRMGPDGERLSYTFTTAEDVTPGWVEMTELDKPVKADAPQDAPQDTTADEAVPEPTPKRKPPSAPRGKPPA